MTVLHNVVFCSIFDEKKGRNSNVFHQGTAKHPLQKRKNTPLSGRIRTSSCRIENLAVSDKELSIRHAIFYFHLQHTIFF